jgi:hypothetical protein
MVDESTTQQFRSGYGLELALNGQSEYMREVHLHAEALQHSSVFGRVNDVVHIESPVYLAAPIEKSAEICHKSVEICLVG